MIYKSFTLCENHILTAHKLKVHGSIPVEHIVFHVKVFHFKCINIISFDTFSTSTLYTTYTNFKYNIYTAMSKNHSKGNKVPTKAKQMHQINADAHPSSIV